MPVESKTKKNVAVISFIIAAAVMFFGVFTVGVGGLDDYILISLIAIIAPFAILDYIDFKWRKSIDEHLPELFRNLVQAQQVGMTLPEALEEVSKRDYGQLTGEIKKINIQISWGASLEEALLAFSSRVGTVMTQRIVPMIIEAGRSGGHVEKVFEPMGSFIQTNMLLEKDRKSETKPYIAIIYVAVFVFIFTIIIIFKTFYTSVDGAALFLTQENSASLKRIFLHMILIQGFFSGLVAGKMGEGTINAGLKHSLIIMMLGYLSLRFLL